MATIRKRMGRHGNVSYTAMVRRVGFPTLTETFPTKREAETWAHTQEADISAGKVSKDALGRKRTLADAVERYRREVLPLKRNGSMYGFTLDWWVAQHGTKRLGEISRGWLSDCRAELLTGTFRRATPGSKRSLFQSNPHARDTGAMARSVTSSSAVEGIAVAAGTFKATHTGMGPPMYTRTPATEGVNIDRVKAAITAAGGHIVAAKEMLAPEYARTPATANRYMAALSSVFSHVCGDWEWLRPHDNPFTGLVKLPEGRNKGRAYSPDAITRLLQEARQEPQLYTLVQVALATAARAGELLGLTWSHVELGETEGRLMFTDTKNGEARMAWLFGDALQALTEHRARLGMREHVAGDTDVASLARMLSRPVFPGQWSHKDQKYGRYDYLPRLHAALKRAGLDMPRPFHALRHTAATTMARTGANAHQLKALGGWKSDAVNRYVHMAAQDTKGLAQEYAKRLQQEGK
jgi:integrase